MHWTEQKPDVDAPLSEARRLQDQAAKMGFDWDELAPLWNKLAEETDEFREAVDSGDKQAMQDELGDLLFMLVNFSRFLGLSPAQALHGTNQKFVRRLSHVETRLTQAGLDWSQASMDQLENWWQDAKKHQAQRPK